MTHEVFISYSHHDKLIADGVCANLEAAGIRCWIAPRDIAPGHDWPTSISEAITHSRVMALIFSSRSNKSKDVGRELILASDSNCIIVPFKIEDIEPEPGKKYYLARTHWLDAMDPPTQEQVDKLVDCVHALLVEAGVKLAPKPRARQQPIAVVDQSPSTSHSAKPAKIPAPKSPKLTARKPTSRLGIVSGFTLGGLVLVIGVLLILQNVFDVPVLSVFFSQPTLTATFTVTPSPALRPTHTTEPTSTDTPLPSWVTNFAQPILDAIADQPPTFQDDFGPSSAGWYNTDGWTETRIEYIGEEIVVTGNTLDHAGLDIPDFVVEIDGRFLARSDQDVDWGITFRDTTCTPCEVLVHNECDISLKILKITEDYLRLTNVAKCGDQTNHLMMIAKGTSLAVYINDRPLYFIDDLVGRWGGIKIHTWNDGSTTSDVLPSIAFDNFKIWDIYNIP